MLASACKDMKKLDFTKNTYLATPKLDGIRALKINGKLVSRTFKPIRNLHIKRILETVLPDGADGEIVCPGAFQATSSGVMGSEGTPEFIYYWFDYVPNPDKLVEEDRIQYVLGTMKTALDMPYSRRMDYLLSEYGNMATLPGSEKVHALVPITLKDLDHLQTHEQKCIDDGFEGLCVRTSTSPYKCGRATEKQQWLLKIKRFADDEAEILDFGEKMHNDNPAEKDNFGRTKRSSAQDGLRPAGTLGYLVVKDIKSGIKFEVGTGFDDELRQEIWDNRPQWKGLIIKYKHFAVSGVKDKPRFPVYLGIRDKDDM